MTPDLARFLDDESGATSTDWVVISAFAVGIVVATMTLVGSGAADHGELVETTFQSRGIPTYGLAEVTDN